jgi:soluble lytic murein transglycosylase
MSRARLGHLRLASIAVALCAGLAVPAVAHAAGTDPMITGSINPNAVVPAEPQGSPAFRKALAALVSGDQAGAYQLASALPDNLERRTIQWAAIYYGNGIIDYHAVKRFADDAPEFASEALYKIRLEQSLVTANPSPADIIANLGGSVPNSVKGQIMLAAAYEQAGQHDRAVRLAREVWVDNTLDSDSEKLALSSIGRLLTRTDHWARTVHLLMNDRASSAGRMLGMLSPAQKSLATAGIAVINNGSNAGALLAPRSIRRCASRLCSISSRRRMPVRPMISRARSPT